MGARPDPAHPLTCSRLLCVLITLGPALILRAESLVPAAGHAFASAGPEADPVAFVMAQSEGEGPPAEAASAPAVAKPAGASLMSLLFHDAPGRWPAMPPLRWQGSLTFEERLTSNSFGKTSQSMEYARLATSTYIREPWIAQVTANLGLLTQQERVTSDNPDVAPSTSQRGVAVTGGGMLSVFPRSRFPFTATFDNTDSRTSGDVVASDYVSRLLALRQTYRTPLGDQIYTGSLERSTLISDSFGRDTVTALNGTMNRTLPTHVIDVLGAIAENRRSATDDGARTMRLSGHDNWRPNDTTTLDSLASFSLIDALNSGNRDRFLQLNTFGTWRPSEDSPFFVTGGGRYADTAFDSGGQSVSVRTLSTNAAVTYALTERANVFGAMNLARVQSNESSAFLTTQVLGANYTSAPYHFGGFDYSWSTSANGSNQTSTAGTSQRTLLGQLGHQVSRGFRISDAVQLSANVNETGSVFRQSDVGVSHTLQHSAGVSLNVTPNPASSALVSATVGDSRTEGANPSSFQIANVQTSGNLQLGVFSLLSANLTVQAVRQRNRLEDNNERTSVMRSGNVTYHHRRLFRVRSLRFVATAQFNDVQLESRLLGDINAPHDQYTRFFESRLEYTIGRLDFRLGTRIAQTDGRTDRQLFFRVNRDFGLY